MQEHLAGTSLPETALQQQPSARCRDSSERLRQGRTKSGAGSRFADDGRAGNVFAAIVLW